MDQTTESDFNYKNVEIKQMGGTKMVRKVTIKNGKGHKSITKYNKKGKQISKVRKSIKNEHVKMIKSGKFVMGLFNDCNGKKCNKTMKNKR